MFASAERGQHFASMRRVVRFAKDLAVQFDRRIGAYDNDGFPIFAQLRGCRSCLYFG